MKTHHLNKKLLTAYLIITTLLITPAATAHKGATGLVKERMDDMIELKDAGKSISNMLRGKTSYNKMALESAAQIIINNAGANIIDKFPESTAEDKHTDAKAIIWQNWDEFTALATQLEKYSQDFFSAVKAEQPIKATRQQADDFKNTKKLSADSIAELPLELAYKRVQKTCSSCHKKFRKKKNK